MATKITGTNTAAAPGVTGDDTDTGLFYGTNEIGFSTGGTSKATIDSSGSLKFNQTQSKILVNTADGSDSSWLNINGGGDASQTRGAGLAIYGNENSGSEGKLWLLAGNSGSANGVIAMNTAGQERLRIDSSGRLLVGGTGNTDSDVRLYLHNSGAAGSQLQFTGNASGIGNSDGFRVGYNGSGGQMWLFENQYLRFATNNTERLRIDSNGRLGIGTASPQENLHILSTTGSSRIRMTSADGSDNMIVFGDASDQATGAIKFDHSDESLALFGYNNAEKLRIDSSGYVGLKLTDPSTYYAKDLVIGCIDQGGITLKSSSTSDTQYLMFADGTSGNERYRGYIGYQHNTGSGGGEHLQLAASGSMVLRVDSDGLKFGSDTAAVNALSDYEEGNYTVTLDGQTGGDYTLNGSYDQLAYTKVGRVIHISGRVRITAKNNPTGDYIKMNLPTTSASLGEDRGRVTGTVYVQYSNKAVNDFIVLPTIEGNSYVQLAHVDYDGTGFNNMNSQFSGDELISINITYVSA
jgi:hypothetical protein